MPNVDVVQSVGFPANFAFECLGIDRRLDVLKQDVPTVELHITARHVRPVMSYESMTKTRRETIKLQFRTIVAMVRLMLLDKIVPLLLLRSYSKPSQLGFG